MAGVTGGLQGPWYRIQSILSPARGASAEWDFVTVLPAVLSAAQSGRPFVVGWMSRGGGAPLELITNAGPLTPSADRQQGLLFPHGARGVEIGDEWLADASTMTWSRCPARQAPPLISARGDTGPSLFESTLVTLMGRPFGWLVIAEQCGEQVLKDEVTDLQYELQMQRRGDDELAVERLERRMAELDAFQEAGLWNVRVLAGAESVRELDQIAPVLVGSVGMSHHPYRLRSGERSVRFHEALHVDTQDHDLKSPFIATAGTLAALAGLPRREVPGLRVLDAGYFDVTSEVGGPRAARPRLGDPRRPGPPGRDVQGPAADAQPPRVRHRRDRLRQVPDRTPPARTAHAWRASRGSPSSRPSPSTPRWRAGRRARDRHQPLRPGRRAAVGEPARPRARATPCRRTSTWSARCSRRRSTRRSRSRRSCRRRCSGCTRPTAGTSSPAAAVPGSAIEPAVPDARTAPERRAPGDQRRRVRQRADGRREGLRERTPAVAADRLGRPFLRGRPPRRHRGPAEPQRRARHRGRRQRRGQGVPDGHADHPHRRAPAAARPRDRAGTRGD